MIKVTDRIKAFFYRLLRSVAANDYNFCSSCKKKKKNFTDFLYKSNYFIGYDKILNEWVVFVEHNIYAKIWILNGYIVDVYELNEPIWQDIRYLCYRCIKKYFKTNELQ